MENIQDQLNIILGLHNMDDMDEFIDDGCWECKDLESWLARNETDNSVLDDDDYFDMDH